MRLLNLAYTQDEIAGFLLGVLRPTRAKKTCLQVLVTLLSVSGAPRQPGKDFRGDDYLGLGCAAFGTLSRPTEEAPGAGLRYRNAPNPERYLERASAGDFAPHEQEALSGETRLRERIMLGLRLREGLDLEAAASALGVEPWPEARRRAAERLVERGRLAIDGERLRVPEDAWLFADGTAVELF